MSAEKTGVDHASPNAANGHGLEAIETNDTVAPEIIGVSISHLAFNRLLTS